MVGVTDIALEDPVIDLADLVPTPTEAERHGRQVAEHALADVEEAGVGFVVGLVAVDPADAVERTAVQIVEPDMVLGAPLLVFAGLRQYVDRCAGDQIQVVLVRGGEGVTNLLAYQYRRAID